MLETGRYATVGFGAPISSHLHFESLLSLLGSLRKQLKTKFTSAVSCVYSLSLSLSLSLSPSLSLSLSLSLRVSTPEKKKSCPLITVDSSKSSQSLQFQVYSFSSGLRVQYVEVELRAGTRTVPVLQLWNRERSSEFQR